MKPIAWYDPTNDVVSTDKDSPLFTPLGQVWPLYSQSGQEPVAWRAKNFYENQDGWFYAEWHQDGLTPQGAELLYTTPPQRTWVGLTDQEIEDAIYDGFAFGLDNGNVSNQTVIRHVIRVIEAKLKDKNVQR